MALSVRASTLMTVVQRVSDAYRVLGGESLVVLSHNRGLRVPGMDARYVDFTENCPREWFNRAELAIDVVAGRFGALRPYYGRMYDPAVRAIEDAGADVVLLYEGHYASATLPQWSRVRDQAELVLYVHNPLSRTYGRRELRRLVDRADRVVFCAEHLRRHTVRRLGHDDPRLEVVPNGVSPVYFGAPRQAPGTEEPFVVTFVGKVAEHKGLHVLLEAAALAAARIERAVRVRVVGSSRYGGGSAQDDYETAMLRRCAELGLDCTFLGWSDEAVVVREMQAASVVCLPSLWAEGLPLTALQAMAAGTPVACSDSDGMVEAVGDAGLVSRAGDAEALAGSLARLAVDREAWEALSNAGIGRARHFTWTSTAARLAGAEYLSQLH
jgi:glycosyltransferase involved in cell wall biosynthesis